MESVGPQVGRREFVLQLSDGEHVNADERFFLVESGGHSVSRAEWTAEEKQVMADYKWWSPDDLAQTSEDIWPEDLSEMLGIAIAAHLHSR